MVMPFLVKALLDNRDRFAGIAERTGEQELFRQEPKGARLLAPARGVPVIQPAGSAVAEVAGRCARQQRVAARKHALVTVRSIG